MFEWTLVATVCVKSQRGGRHWPECNRRTQSTAIVDQFSIDTQITSYRGWLKCVFLCIKLLIGLQRLSISAGGSPETLTFCPSEARSSSDNSWCVSEINHALTFFVKQWNFPRLAHSGGLPQSTGPTALPRDWTIFKTSGWHSWSFAALITHTEVPIIMFYFLYFQMSADSGRSVSFRLEQLTKLLYSIEDKVKHCDSFYWLAVNNLYLYTNKKCVCFFFSG